MTPVVRIDGIAAPLPIDNVDTDCILPGRYLKTISRIGLGRRLFADLREDESGVPRAAFILNQPNYDGARILIGGANFGCGSSREHAPWALLDYGIGCVVAAGFADIFFANSVNCGLLPATVTVGEAAELARIAAGRPMVMNVDLEARLLAIDGGPTIRFTIPEAARDRLLRGLDMIGETIGQEAAIAAFEASNRARHGWSRRLVG